MSSPRPHVIVLFGAAGDLAHRKLLPGILRLSSAGLMPEFELVGTSLEPLDDEGFRELARTACSEFSRAGVDPAELEAFAGRLTYVDRDAGAAGLAAAVAGAEARLGGEPGRLHYLSVPPPRPARWSR